MLDTDTALNTAEQIKNRLQQQLIACEALEAQEAASKAAISSCTSLVKSYTIIKELFIKAGSESRDLARKHFEKIVTTALQFVTQDTSVRFVIEENIIRGKPAYEFYVETCVDGKPVKQKPEDSVGGGFIDIISMTLKYAYNQLFSDPHIMNNTVLLDEPAKMVSEQMSVKTAEYIKFLNKYFHKQTIMITHNENLGSIADHYFTVSKNGNGFSDVTEENPGTASAFAILKQTGEEMKND